MKKLLTLIIAFTLLTACSGDEDTVPFENEQPELSLNLLPKDITTVSADGTMKTIHFEYHSLNDVSGIINKIVYEDNSYDEFIYDAHFHIITRINRIKNGKTIEYTLFDYDLVYRLTTKKRYVYIENNAEPLVYISNINHNTNNHVNITQYSENDPDFEPQNHSYDSYFNHYIFAEDNKNNTSRSFEYDNNTHPPYLYVSHVSSLRWIYPYFTDRNIVMLRKYINGVNAGQDRYEYLLNVKNYPIEVKSFNNGNNQLLETTTYTYYNE